MTRFALSAAIVAALAATVAAVLQANPAVLGWLAALAAFAIAGAAASAAGALHAPNDVREPREARGPSPLQTLPDGATTRQGAFGKMWGYALAAFAVLGAVPFVALARRPASQGTAWRRGVRLVTPDGKPLKFDDLEVGAIETVFPQGSIGAPASATLLLRLEDNALRTHPDRADWAPRGNVAYSKICTHAGCPVAIYRQESYELYCPCHQSVFDVLDAARPVSGPATRALPQLALDVDAGGYLIARGDYSEPVGPDDWWRTT